MVRRRRRPPLGCYTTGVGCLWGLFPPGDEDAALESEDELRLRLLALSGADTLVEVGLVTDIDSTFS